MSVSFIQLMNIIWPIIQTGNKVDFMASAKRMVQSRVYGEFATLINRFCCGAGVIQVSYNYLGICCLNYKIFNYNLVVKCIIEENIFKLHAKVPFVGLYIVAETQDCKELWCLLVRR